jgi:hypothetical protein
VLTSDKSSSSSENEVPGEENEEVHDSEVVEFTRKRLEANLKQIKRGKINERKKRPTKKK